MQCPGHNLQFPSANQLLQDSKVSQHWSCRQTLSHWT